MDYLHKEEMDNFRWLQGCRESSQSGCKLTLHSYLLPHTLKYKKQWEFLSSIQDSSKFGELTKSPCKHSVHCTIVQPHTQLSTKPVTSFHLVTCTQLCCLAAYSYCPITQCNLIVRMYGRRHMPGAHIVSPPKEANHPINKYMCILWHKRQSEDNQITLHTSPVSYTHLTLPTIYSV